jgi:hypothetical protein
MGQAQRETFTGRSPEQGGTSAEELAYRLRQQELLAGFGRLALETQDFTSLLQEATRLCAEGMHTRFCKVMEFLPAQNEFVVRAGVGWKPGVVGAARTGADLDSPSGFALKTGQPVISNHLAKETRFRTPKLRLFSNSGLGVKLSMHILAGSRVLSAVRTCLPHDGVR